MLHDIDFELYPEKHCLKARAAGLDVRSVVDYDFTAMADCEDSIAEKMDEEWG